MFLPLTKEKARWQWVTFLERTVFYKDKTEGTSPWCFILNRIWGHKDIGFLCRLFLQPSAIGHGAELWSVAPEQKWEVPVSITPETTRSITVFFAKGPGIRCWVAPVSHLYHTLIQGCWSTEKSCVTRWAGGWARLMQRRNSCLLWSLLEWLTLYFKPHRA